VNESEGGRGWKEEREGGRVKGRKMVEIGAEGRIEVRGTGEGGGVGRHACICTHSFIHSFVHSFIPPFIYSRQATKGVGRVEGRGGRAGGAEGRTEGPEKGRGWG
jgi:hypothetical protein